MMYTIEPYGRIFGGENKTTTLQLEFGVVEVDRCGDGLRVRRVISTRLSDYLDPRLAPGSEIKSMFRM